jgi:hypothetical protein
VTGHHLFTFVLQLPGHLKRPRLVIWGRFSGPKKAARLLQEIYGRRIQVASLPAYAPDLNVVDHAWGPTTYDIARWLTSSLEISTICLWRSQSHYWPNIGDSTS